MPILSDTPKPSPAAIRSVVTVYKQKVSRLFNKGGMPTKRVVPRIK